MKVIVDKANVGKRATIVAVRNAHLNNRARLIGQSGIIKQAVKSRNVYTIELDDEDEGWWDAMPENVSIQ